MAKIAFIKKFNSQIYPFYLSAVEENDQEIFKVNGDFEHPSNESVDLIRAYVLPHETGLIISTTGEVLDIYHEPRRTY